MGTTAHCTAWCDGEHLTDPAVDAVHQLALTPVPVVALNRQATPFDADVVRIIEATDVEVAAYQYVGDLDVLGRDYRSRNSRAAYRGVAGERTSTRSVAHVAA